MMTNYIQIAGDGVKKIFSSTESFILTLQKAFVAVRDALKFWRPSNSESSDPTDVMTALGNSTSEASKNGVLNIFYFPFCAKCSRQYCDSGAENISGNHCVICSSVCSSCQTSGACPKYCLQTFFLVTLFYLFYLCCVHNNDYVSTILEALEHMDIEIAIVIFMLLFIVACLPLVWGYVVLNMAAGYRFGALYGIFLVMVSVSIGITVTHRFSQKFCNGCVTRALKCYGRPEYISAILKVLDGPSGLKVVALARLTPIPFGIQNGIFSLANIKTRYYVAASSIGLLPTQMINCYMGSTFRSGQDIIEQGSSVSGYMMFILQVVVGVILMWFVLHRARQELANVLVSSSNEGTASSDEHDLTEVRVSQPVSGTVV